MKGQALAMELQKVYTGHSIEVICHALALTAGTFAAACGLPPEMVLRAIGQEAWHHMLTYDNTPVPPTEVN